MKLRMMIGIPGSGKSTFAKRYLSGEYISSDDLRDELHKVDIWDEMLVRTEVAFKSGKDVIYDATSIKKRDRSVVLKLAREYGAKTVSYIMETPYNKCIEWNRKRVEDRIVPNHVIERMIKEYEPPSSDEFDEMVYVSLSEDYVEPKLYVAGKGYYYTGCFLNKTAAMEMKKHRLGKPLSNPNIDLHMTIQFSPQNVDERLFGERINLKVIGYGINEDNEGFYVKAYSDNAYIQKLIDSIENPHVTMSISERGRHHNTQYIHFQDIEPFEVFGTYGGCVCTDNNSKQIILQYNDSE